MKLFAAFLTCALLATGVAGAASPYEAPLPHGSGPGAVPVGAGYQLGVEMVNNSGQAGFITLFDRGPETGVVVAIEGSHGKPEPVIIRRGKSCSDPNLYIISILPGIGMRLADLERGVSRSFAHKTQDRILSGNYLVVVYPNSHLNARPVACGELYR